MANPNGLPVMQPFPDKEGTGWHVIRYHQDHERRVEGFSTEASHEMDRRKFRNLINSAPRRA
jgi:hypothetical protein